MVKFKIYPKRSCLIVVDMTNGFLRPGAPMEVPGGRDLIPRLKRLVSICRNKGLMVIFTTHAFRNDGCDLGLSSVFRPEINKTNILREGTADTDFYSEVRPKKNDVVIVKRRFSAFSGTDLEIVLRSNKIDTLIIGGVASNVCCECTARDARMKDYKVVFLSDGTAAGRLPNMGWGEVHSEEVRKNVLTTMACHFAQVLSVEEVIDRLLKVSL